MIRGRIHRHCPHPSLVFLCFFAGTSSAAAAASSPLHFVFPTFRSIIMTRSRGVGVSSTNAIVSMVLPPRRTTRQSMRLLSSSPSPVEGGDPVPDVGATPVTKRRRKIAAAAADASNQLVDGPTLPMIRNSTTKRSKSTTTVSEQSVVTTKGVKQPSVSSPSAKSSIKPPAGWEDIYSLVEELRFDRTAPVDSNGSEVLPQRHLGERTFRFQVLIALMLSSQTKDAVVGETMRNLQDYGLTVEKLAETSSETLNSLLQKVGFHNNKTKYILQVVQVLQEKYDCDIPSTAQELMELPGVGPKMAFIVENVAWNKCTGIGVDTHMHRMFNELKWVQSKTPEQTRMQLESWLPRDKWSTVNLLWVGFGQEVQQFKPKLLRKILDCSRPADALRLVKRLGLDYKKEGEKLGLMEEIQKALIDK